MTNIWKLQHADCVYMKYSDTNFQLIFKGNRDQHVCQTCDEVLETMHTGLLWCGAVLCCDWCTDISQKPAASIIYPKDGGSRSFYSTDTHPSAPLRTEIQTSHTLTTSASL